MTSKKNLPQAQAEAALAELIGAGVSGHNRWRTAYLLLGHLKPAETPPVRPKRGELPSLFMPGADNSTDATEARLRAYLAHERRTGFFDSIRPLVDAEDFKRIVELRTSLEKEELDERDFTRQVAELVNDRARA